MKRLAVIWLCATSSLFAENTLSLEQIAADPGLWPSEVMVVVEHKIPVTGNGKKAKSRQAGPGRTYQVKSIDANGVTLVGPDATLTFKVDETDLIARSEQLKAYRDAPAPTPAQPATAPIQAPEPAATQANSEAGPRMVVFEPKAPEPSAVESAPISKPAAPAKATGGNNVMAQKLDGMLVQVENGELKPYDAQKLSGKKFIAVYFSASWCGPCRKFTPGLVDWYSKKKTVSDDFEVIFVTRDEDESSMMSYMLSDHMEWPAISFKAKETNPLMKYAGRGIPSMVIIDESGSVLSNSFAGEQYLGPLKPLKDLETYLKTL